MATDVRIPPLRFFTQRVLPAVYTDELSYYEALAKVVDKLNELIDVVGDSATIEQIQQVIKDIEKELSALYVYVDKEVQGAKDYSDDQNDTLEKYLVSLILDATVGKVLVQSQTGGGICPLQEELDRQYDFLRSGFKVDARIIRGKAVASVYIDVDYMSNYYGVTGQRVATWANEGLHGGKNLATNTPHVWDETMANTVDNGALLRDAVAYLRSQGFTVRV